MDKVKSIWASKTVWGIIFSVLGKISAAYFGFDVFDEAGEKIVTGIEQIGMQKDLLWSGVSLVISGIGDAIAYYGRKHATTVIAKPNA